MSEQRATWDCDHEHVEWGDGLADAETGIVEDPDYLGICSDCGAWTVRFEDGRVETA